MSAAFPPFPQAGEWNSALRYDDRIERTLPPRA
jgi:hypothetical protein